MITTQIQRDVTNLELKPLITIAKKLLKKQSGELGRASGHLIPVLKCCARQCMTLDCTWRMTARLVSMIKTHNNASVSSACSESHSVVHNSIPDIFCENLK